MPIRGGGVHTIALGCEADLKNAENQDSEGPESAYSVEKLCFQNCADFICDLSGITYCRYEGVAEVA